MNLKTCAGNNRTRIFSLLGMKRKEHDLGCAGNYLRISNIFLPTKGLMKLIPIIQGKVEV